MVKKKERQVKKELRKQKADIDFLLKRLKEKGEHSGEYAGTILFLNTDAKKVEDVLLAKLAEVKDDRKIVEGNFEMELILTEWSQTILRLIRKFNRRRDFLGQYGKHYALDLDADEFCFLRRLLDKSGITYWEHF